MKMQRKKRQNQKNGMKRKSAEFQSHNRLIMLTHIYSGKKGNRNIEYNIKQCKF